MRVENHFPQSLETLSGHPLASKDFFNLLEKSEVVGGDSGWHPLYFNLDDSILPSFIKTHSYGEYIFDWAWAEFYQKYQVPYYPKLVHCLPFTPIQAPKVWGSNQEELMKRAFQFYQSQEVLSGEHYLFTNQNENQILRGLGFEIMETVQFHWKNIWNHFGDYLESLTKNRKTMIKKERKKVASYDLTIKHLQGEDLTDSVMKRVYALYLTTIDKKNSMAYLNESFFVRATEFLKEKLLVVAAFKSDEMIAMSLFIKGEKTLYGRYWGIDPALEADYPLLHFELCYYRGMDECFLNHFDYFEAGAQGEQKLWRGFSPVTITSAHHLRLKSLFEPVVHYIKEQNKRNQELISHYQTLLPFKPS
jgi:uncharacterized protein